MGHLISDICRNSSVEKGLCMSDDEYKMLTDLKNFNYEYIYSHKWFDPYIDYSKLVISTIFDVLFSLYEESDTWEQIDRKRVNSSTLCKSFKEWLADYTDISIVPDDLRERTSKKNNIKIYSRLETKQIYAQAIIDYISGMTDRFAVKVYNEIISYE